MAGFFMPMLRRGRHSPEHRTEAAAFVVAALGTSLTAKGGWLSPLEQALRERLGGDVSVRNFGGAGRTSRWGLRQTAAIGRAAPRAVLVEFATNDAALRRGMSLAASCEAMTRIVERLRRHDAQMAVWLMAMNPVHGFAGLLRPRFDAYCDAHARLAQALAAGFIDHRPAWDRLGAAALLQAIPDGLHPLPGPAAQIMVPVLVEALSAPPRGHDGRNFS